MSHEDILFHLRAGRLLKYGHALDKWWLTTLYPWGGSEISVEDVNTLFEFNWIERCIGRNAFQFNWRVAA